MDDEDSESGINKYNHDDPELKLKGKWKDINIEENMENNDDIGSSGTSVVKESAITKTHHRSTPLTHQNGRNS